jgi:hypothetical protein
MIARPFRLRAGYCAVEDLSTANIDVNGLVQRARSALDHIPADGHRATIVSFDDLPLTRASPPS